MEIVLINGAGNLLPQGKFTLHSEFKEVVNFINSEQQILTLAYDEKFLSPNTILISGANFSFIETILIDEKKISFWGIDFYMDEFEIFDSFFKYKSSENINLKTKISKFEDAYLSKFNEKSLRFLLNEKYETNFESSFDKAFVKHIKAAFNEIQNNDFYAGISKIKGSGFGLTPSGDDFVAGMLYAFDVLKNISSNQIDVDLNKIRETATGKNPISNSLIYYASKGAYYKRFKDFLEAFLYDEDKLEQTFNNLIEIGETSSSDMLTGFLTTLNKNLIHSQTN